MRKYIENISSLLPFSALMISSLPLLNSGFPNGHDWIYELIRIFEFKLALSNGQYPPFWAENLYAGYGSPIFLFYAPLFLFTASLFSLLPNGDIPFGGTSALLLFSLIAVLAVKKMMQAAFGEENSDHNAASRIAVYFFILNPYLICDKLLRNANAEYTAWCIAPIAFWGLLIMGQKPLLGGIILSAGLALSVIAHNLSSLVITGLIVTLALVLYFRNLKTVFRVGLSILLGLIMSAFFWVPAIYYKSLIRTDQLISGKFDFHTQFQPVKYFIAGNFFSIGMMPFLVILYATIIWLFPRNRNQLSNKKLFVFLVASAFFFIFLQTPASLLVWETLPYMPLFQFPWRMMGPLALIVSVLAGLAFPYLCREKTRNYCFFLEIVILGFCIINAIPHLMSSRPVPENIMVSILKRDVIQRQGHAATVKDEYLPKTADPEIWKKGQNHNKLVIYSDFPVELSVVEKSATKIVLANNAAKPATIHLRRWNFPDWHYSINGEKYQARMNASGTVVVSLPKGSNKITLESSPPLLRRIGVWVSLSGLIFWLFLLLYLRFDFRKKPPLFWGIVGRKG